MKNHKYTELQIRRAFKAMYKEMNDITFEKTIKDKSGCCDVSQADWNACSFSFDDMENMLIERLNSQPQPNEKTT